MPASPKSSLSRVLPAPSRVRELEAELAAVREESAAQVEQARQIAVRAVQVKIDELNAANAKLAQAVAFINRIGDGSAGRMSAAMRAAQDELAAVKAKTAQLRAEQQRATNTPLVPPAPDPASAKSASAPTRRRRLPSLSDIPTWVKVIGIVAILVLTFILPNLGFYVAVGTVLVGIAGWQALIVGHAFWAGLISRWSGLAVIMLCFVVMMVAVGGASSQMPPRPDTPVVQTPEAPEEPAPAPPPPPAPEPVPAPAPAPEPAPEPAPAPAPAPEPSVSYKNCSEVKAAGAAPITSGQPGYGNHLDRDGDGIGCES